MSPAKVDPLYAAVEKTAACKRVEHDWRQAPAIRWVAELWCTQIGETVLGVGPTAWDAVQAAHAKRDSFV